MSILKMDSIHTIFDIIPNVYETKRVRVNTGTTNKFIYKWLLKYHFNGENYQRYFGNLEYEDAISQVLNKTESP